MGFGQNKAATAVKGFDDPTLAAIRDQAHAAQVARRKTFVARLVLPDDAPQVGDVPLWAAAIQQVEQFGFTLTEWSVSSEARPAAYAVFHA